MRGRSSAAALVEQQDVIFGRVELAAVVLVRSAARPASLCSCRLVIGVVIALLAVFRQQVVTAVQNAFESVSGAG